MSKPTVFNYNEYVRMEDERDRLQGENQELQEKIAQLQIRCRITEEDLRQSQNDLLKMGTSRKTPEEMIALFRSYAAERFFDKQTTDIVGEAADMIEELTTATDKARREEEDPQNDPVNHPAHYCGQIETIDFIRDRLTKEGFAGYCAGNVMKYISRYDKKQDQIEDLQKAGVYLGWLIDTLKEGE